ncbi:MAG: hypothetical protein QXD61_10575 [Candidatus Caldarchaeum sp.]
MNPWDNGGYTARQRAVIAVEMLREITRDIADVSSASSAVLLRELIKLYEKGVPKSSDVVNRLEEFFRTAMMERRLAEANMAAALLRRLQWLVIDEERSVVNLRGSEQVIIYDLSQLGSSYLKTMYAIAVLSKTYYEAMNGLTNSLTTLLVAEEAQNYIRARRPEDPPSTGERVVNELRAYGVGAVIVSPDLEQLPWHIAKDVGAVVSIGAESMPYTVKDNALRTIDPRHTRRLLTGRKVYIHYNGRLKIVSPPKPPRPIDLKVATVVEETESKEKQPEQADENVQATIEQKVTTESSEESLEEGPKGM